MDTNPATTSREEEIFHQALAAPTPAERRAILEQACGNDGELRARVEALIAAHDQASIQFGQLQGRIAETAGAAIDRYRLLQQIGEGGFGAVFMAEQQHPVRRKVALKIIKLGMDTKQVIARFEAERQALAMMDHPNIAKVLDGGTTQSGRPYFVMELVAGDLITDYCDRNHLTIDERLELLIQVCQAVQHAHQKGIIHRDLKPTNVLVSTQDGRAVAKVIDFGIAKATAAQLTERTLFTEHRQLIGTPQYMSPEQADGSLDIDTRTDVYSLGVLTYELLTGATPFDPKALRSAAYAEMQRIIREVEPPRPSTRISQTHETLPSVAAHRKVEPARLGKLLRGELDWIVMRAMEKDRARRYETANALSMDLQRYLRDEPVLACPPSASYRFGKFARRNKAALAAASAFVVFLLLAIAGLIVSNRLIAAQRNVASQALKDREKALAVAQDETKRAEVNFLRSLIAIRDVMTRPVITSKNMPDDVRRQLIDAATKFYGELMEEGSANPDMQYQTAVGYRGVALLHRRLGDIDRSSECYSKAIQMLEKVAQEHPEVALYRRQLAYTHLEFFSMLRSTPQESLARQHFEKSARLYEAVLLEEPDSYPTIMEAARLYNEGMRVAPQGEEKAFRRALELANSAIPRLPKSSRMDSGATEAGIHGLIARIYAQRAAIFNDSGNFSDALQMNREQVQAYEQARKLEEKKISNWKSLAEALHWCAEDNVRLGHMTEAEADYRRSIQVIEEANQKYPGGEITPWDRAGRMGDLVGLLVGTGRPAEAIPVMKQTLEINRDDHYRWYQAAALALACDDNEGYRMDCMQMLERFEKQGLQDPHVAERTAKTCAILANAVKDFNRVEKLANRAVTNSEGDPDYRFFVLAKLISDYRANHFEESLKWIDRYKPQAGGAPWEATAFAIAAMDHHRLGHASEAANALKAAQAIVAALPNDPVRVLIWHECIYAKRLTAEAEQTIGVSPRAALTTHKD